MEATENSAKKTVVLNGSPKKERSVTMAVTRAFVKGMESAGATSEYITVSDLNIKPCLGCLSCWSKTEGRCVIQNDDIAPVKQKIEGADFVIESFPLYFFGMPGTLKQFTDRMLSMLKTYDGHKPMTDESYHGIRDPKPGRRFLIISSCAQSEIEGVFDSLIKQFDCICGKGNYTAILCPQLQTLVDMGDSPRLTRYLKKFEDAGKVYAEAGALDEETVKQLCRPPFSGETYKMLLNKAWELRRKGFQR